MKHPEKRTISIVKAELSALTDYFQLALHPKVKAAISEVRKENEPKIKDLKEELAKLKEKKSPKKPRWPESTPQEIIDTCTHYWSGTTSLADFRIHEWDENAIWTSYPAGGYSTNGGWNPSPACYTLISRTERGGRLSPSKPRELAELSFERNSGKRVTPAMRLEKLKELSKP